MIANDVLTRVKVCLLMAAVNFSSILLPVIPRSLVLPLALLVAGVNLAIGGFVVRGVAASSDPTLHVRAANLAKIWAIVLVLLSTSVVLILAYMGGLHKQDVMFFLSGFGFILLSAKSLDLSIKKRIEEISNSR